MIFTSTTPAWNSPNLSRLASKTASALVFAHVRATTAGSLSEQNCHPFSCGTLMFMHNGGIGAWEAGGGGGGADGSGGAARAGNGKSVKRRLVESVGDRWFAHVQGNTDSEWAFAVFLDSLAGLGADPAAAELPPRGFGHSVLRKALLRTIERINEVVRECVGVGEDGGSREDAVSLLNFAVTDGHSVVCSRYVSSRTDEAASLFFSSGTSWKAPTRDQRKGQYRMERRDKGSDIILVASEPLTFERGTHRPLPSHLPRLPTRGGDAGEGL